MSGTEGLRDRVGRATPAPVQRAIRGATRRLARGTAGSRVLPSFLLIGTQRGGTTSLFHYLLQHPQVRGAVADKEVHFFDRPGFTALDGYRAAFPSAAAVARAERSAGGRVVVGEATPYYLFHPAVPGRVAAALPDVRLIAILRDPVERAWSQYRHECDLGFESLPFPEALEAEEERTAGAVERLLVDPAATSFEHQHHSYVARGRYLEQLERWWAALPRERLLLVRSEDLYADPAGTFDAITAHLGVEPWQPAAWRAYNASTSSGLSDELRSGLRETFRPWNERLAEATGRSWGWDEADA